jgi:GT2 family glycosyltransferase
VVDGLSTDRTREILEGYSERYPFIRILENPKKVTPIAMNLGIKDASGEIVILVNAHSILDKDFLRNNVLCLKRMVEASAIGGRLQTINESKTIISQAIPVAADSLFGCGGRRYRNRTKEGFIKDTLPYCAYRKEIFLKIGYIDEELIRDQDEEFNYRLLKNDGKIYFNPNIKSYLHIRPTLKKLWRQHFQYGYWKVRVAQKVGAIFTWRQLVPGIFVGSLIFCLFFSLVSKTFLFILSGIVSLYIAVNLGFSLHLSLKNKLRFVFVLPVVFATLHFSYGLGFLKGVFDFVILKKHLKKQIKDTPLTR